MITEDQARDLLARAADTIEVPLATEMPPERRRSRWMVPLVAAAAVVVAVLAGFAVGDHDRRPGQEPAPRPIGRTIPSVFAYDEEGATRLLEALGVQVEVHPDRTDPCASRGRATYTDPAVGTPVEPGERVRLFVTDSIDPGWCGQPDQLIWNLLAFADGHGTAPRFADRVAVWVDGARTELTAQQAADVSTWNTDSALGYVLRVGQQQSGTGFDPTVRPRPRLSQDNYTGDEICGGREWPADSRLAGRKAMLLKMTVPPDPHTGLTACAYLDVFTTGGTSVYDPDGRIDALVLRTSRQPLEPSRGPDPTGQPQVTGAAVAQAFLDFAEGGPAPAFEDQVRLYLGNEHVKTLSAAEAANPAHYDVVDECFPDPESSCPRSAIDMLRVHTDRAITEGFDECLGGAIDLLNDDEIGPDHRTVMFRPARDECERPWAVQLIYDFDGRIAKINLRIPETH